MRLLIFRLAMRYAALVLGVAEFFLRWEARRRYPRALENPIDWNALRAGTIEIRKKQARVQLLLREQR